MKHRRFQTLLAVLLSAALCMGLLSVGVPAASAAAPNGVRTALSQPSAELRAEDPAGASAAAQNPDPAPTNDVPAPSADPAAADASAPAADPAPEQGETVTLTADMPLDEYGMLFWEDGKTYVAVGELTIESFIYMDGDVNLYLSEGCVLNCNKSILVNSPGSLTIDGPGVLNATGDAQNAAIGGGKPDISGRQVSAPGTITINDGVITAVGGGSSYIYCSAGIGSGYGGSCGTVIINGGTVTAIGAFASAGIGGAGWYGDRPGFQYCDSVIINGGTVTAIGAGNGSGIGGGGYDETAGPYGGSVGTIVINGGQVTAGSEKGAGIGPSGKGRCEGITLGWTNADDFIEASYSAEVSFAPGRSFKLASSGKLALPDNVDGEKLLPRADAALVKTEADWNACCDAVAGGQTGLDITLACDLSLSADAKMLGTEAHPYAGVFDGGGHTLTVCYNSSETFTAPFRYVEGAAVSRLKTAGALTGGKHCAGLVGSAKGTNLFEDCEVAVSIITSGTHCGGVLGHGGSSATTLEGCVFRGSIQGAEHAGTLWGWSDSGAVPVLQDCLDCSESLYPIGLGYPTAGDGVSNTYYTQADKEMGSSRAWEKRGLFATRAILGTDFTLELPEGTGLIYDGGLYAAAGETLTLALHCWSGSRILWAKEVLPESEGLYTLTVPEGNYKVRMEPITNQCGDDVWYSLDGRGVLEISGNGPMWDYLSLGMISYVDGVDDRPRYKDYPFCKVIIHEGVTSVGEGQFMYNREIQSVSLPSTLERIGPHAFQACIMLESVEIPAGVNLEEKAFEYCECLRKLVLYDGVNVGFRAFSGCQSLLSVTGCGGNMGSSAFMGCFALRSVTLTEGTTGIGINAFMECPNLIDVSLPEGLTSIGERAFGHYSYDTYRITNIRGTVNLPSTLKTVGESAFEGITGAILIPEDLRLLKIGDHAFDGCAGMTGALTFHNAEGYQSVTIGDYAFNGCTGLTALSFGRGPTGNTTVIGDFAFCGCTGLTEVPTIIAYKIGAYAFYGCSNLSGDLKLDTDQVGDHAFAGLTGLHELTIVPWNGVTECGLEIGDEAFAGCTELWSADIQYVSIDSLGSGVFRGCSSLVSVELPDVYCDSLGSEVFSGCSSLRYVLMPAKWSAEGVMTAGCFADCASLESVRLGAKTTEIQENSFNGCRSLSALYIPAETAAIWENAFRNCTSLTDVYYDGDEEGWNSIQVDDGNECLENVTVHYGNGTYYHETGSIVIVEAEHGTITFNLKKLTSSGFFYDYLTATPDPGYQLTKLSLVHENGMSQYICLSDFNSRDKGDYTFGDYGQTLRVYAVFEPILSSTEEAPFQLTQANMPCVLCSGWYEVTEDIALHCLPLLIQGDVHLILDSGKTLTCDCDGIDVPEGSTLTISGSGTLNAKSWYGHHAGIGTVEDETLGTVIINGGTVNAHAAYLSTGIGSGNRSGGGAIVINGGTVTAVGNRFIGIGSAEGYTPTDVTVNGGTVHAIGYYTGDGSASRLYPAFTGNLTLADGLKVTPEGAEEPALYADRLEACAQVEVWVEPCRHEGTPVCVDGADPHCPWCGRLVFDAEGEGTAEAPWLIENEACWRLLQRALADGFETEDKCFLQTADLMLGLADMLGSEEHPFNGHYDGGGCTLTFTAETAEDFCAPFRYVGAAEIENLRVEGRITTSARSAAGLVGKASTSCAVTNCVSEICIDSSFNRSASHSGFVSEGYAVVITGCVFTGSIIGGKSTYCGGFLGWTDGGDSICINCLFDASAMETVSNTANFIRNSGAQQNCYYTWAIGQGRDRGKQTVAVLPGEDVSLDFGEGTVYDVSGITAYPVGLSCDGTFYAGEGDVVSLDLSCGSAPAGAQIVYAVSGGTLEQSENGWTLTMPGEDVVISVEQIILANPFTDVKPDKYYYGPVLWAVNHDPQITNGTSDTTFSPNKTCTRAQVVTFLWRAAGCPEPETTTTPFTDIKATAYYYKAVLWAVENGITAGTSATTFGPNKDCTRAQVVTFLWRNAGQPEPETTVNPFTDVKPTASYLKAVLWAVETGVTTGTSDTTFSPAKTCTRAQVVTFLYRAFEG